MTLKTIECHSQTEHAKSLADYLPGGRVFGAKNLEESNLYKFVFGLAAESQRAEGYLKSLQQEFIPDETDIFLNEWENAVGIPDDCFNGLGTNDERRRDVLLKLASLGVQTEQDFTDLAALLGVTVNIIPAGTPGVGVFPLPYPIPFLSAPRFTTIVEYVGPIPAETLAVLECLFNKLKPANTLMIFIEV